MEYVSGIFYQTSFDRWIKFHWIMVFTNWTATERSTDFPLLSSLKFSLVCVYISASIICCEIPPTDGKVRVKCHSEIVREITPGYKRFAEAFIRRSFGAIALTGNNISSLRFLTCTSPSPPRDLPAIQSTNSIARTRRSGIRSVSRN